MESEFKTIAEAEERLLAVEKERDQWMKQASAQVVQTRHLRRVMEKIKRESDFIRNKTIKTDEERAIAHIQRMATKAVIVKPGKGIV